MATLFQSTSARGLNFHHPAMRRWAKGKRLGILGSAGDRPEQDAAGLAFADRARARILFAVTSQFQAGEEAVTLDLLR